MDENIDFLFNKIASETIKKYRKKKNMSLEDVVSKMRNPITRQSLFKYENNKARMKRETFIDICNVLKIDPSEVFQEINNMASTFASEISKNSNFPIFYSEINKDGKEEHKAIFANNKIYNDFFNNPDKYIEKKNNSYIVKSDYLLENQKNNFKSNASDNQELISNLALDNIEPIDILSEVIKIPVYGTIKAGIPIESQNDIIDYVEIPKDWTVGGKKFYGLRISGDSMFPKYSENDIVIFEQNDDVELYNGKDVAVMINGTESTFKKILVNEQGIVLQPYNTGYDIMMFSKEQVEKLPIKVVGIAREKRTKL